MSFALVRPATAGRPLAARAATLALLVVGALIANGVPARAADPDGLELLERAATLSGRISHSGEILWVTFHDGQSEAVIVDVEARGQELTMRTAGRRTMRLSPRGSGLVDHAGGWYLPLPPGASAARDDSEAMGDKYDVEVLGAEEMVGRPASRLEVRLRATDALRERLWVDDETGLVLRRESYGPNGQMLRLAVYLRLEVTPPGSESGNGQPVPLTTVSQATEEIDGEGLRALRAAGWIVPSQLPRGYEQRAVYAVSGAETSPLHLVYDDGLYSVSVFEQQGPLDTDSLPPGAEQVAAGGGHAWVWPGAMPQRRVWEAGGATFTMVGDAPPQEFLALAAAFPAPTQRGIGERVRAGFARLWSWVSPWS